MDVEVKVEDEDEDKITAGSIVTITTKLTRESMGDITEAADNGEVKFQHLEKLLYKSEPMLYIKFLIF